MEKRREKDGFLLDLNVGEREWYEGEEQRTKGCSEEKKLELRLGPPGGEEEEDWRRMMMMSNRDSVLSLGCSSHMKKKTEENPNGWFMNNNNGGLGGGQRQSNNFSSSTAAVPNSSQKRTAPAPVVGWPPIRSFRKNLATSSSSSKPAANDSPATTPPTKPPSKEPTTTTCQKGLFVKINMDGVPIGRKVDLKSHDTYDKLSGAVDELFRNLLAAQRDSSNDNQEGHKAITGLLDGSGEYTLVYEDNEGDRMLVGDVPWHMFVSTVKRLRVLRSSELSRLCSGSRNGKTSVSAASR